MKLLTKALLKKLPNIGDNEKNNKEHIAHVKLFGGSCWSWFISEFNPDTKMCFGFVEGLENELGFNKDTKTNLTVTYSEGDNYGVTYSKFVPFLVKAVQELSAQVTTLQQELKTIKGE